MSACNMKSNTQPLNLKGFDWTKHQKEFLHHRLDEISGITWNEKSQSFLCINDEFGSMFRIDKDDYQILERIKFGRSADYESIAANDSEAYVMKSSGDLVQVILKDTSATKYKFHKKRIEFEATIWDKEHHRLFLLSKASDENRDNKQSYIYLFDTHKKQFKKNAVEGIRWSDVDETLENLRFSAGAIDPRTGNYYVLASKEKRLIVFSKRWKVLEVYKLDRKLFKQPEGITFDTEGNVYITNEADGGRPNIIKIPIQKQ